MSKRFFFLPFVVIVLLVIQATTLNAQKNIQFLSQYGFNQSASDIWGYTDSIGREYAIVGLNVGTSIVDVSSPTDPIERAYIPGPETIWRDIKVYKNYAYVTNETAEGVLIIDLEHIAQDSVTTYTWTNGIAPNGTQVSMSSAHNIFIDEKGYAYIVGANYSEGGAIILDLNTNPINPQIAGVYDRDYVHDAFVRNDTLWAAQINIGTLAVIDISDRANPIVIGERATTDDFAHNCWLSDNGKTIFTTDEVSDGYITAYDVSDVTDIKELDRIQSSPGANVIPHNSFVLGNYVVTSYYRDGVTIHDATKPNIMVEVGNYDTSADFVGNGFNGAWGVFPYFASGNIIISDIEEGLFVLRPTYTPAAFLTGAVTTPEGTPLSNVNVSITGLNETPNTISDVMGQFGVGSCEQGLVEVTFSAFGYLPMTVSSVMVAGEEQVLDIVLSPASNFALSGIVVDANSGAGVEGATVLLNNPQANFDLTTNADGTFSLPDFTVADYEIVVGKWGYKTKGFPQATLSEETGQLVIELDKGYYDDFAFDFGWTVENAPENGDFTGAWERAEPIGTTYQGGPFATDFDVDNDFSDQCYVTANGPGGAGTLDLDNGDTRLISPVFDLSNYVEPYISYYRWFANDGGLQTSGPPNDMLTVTIDNGITQVVVEVVGPNDEFLQEWHQTTIDVLSVINPTDNMRIIFETGDQDATGHLAEAAVDVFSAYDEAVVPGIETTLQAQHPVTIAPNPFNNNAVVSIGNFDQLQQTEAGDLTFTLYDAAGRVVRTQAVTASNFDLQKGLLNNGMYIYRVTSSNHVIAQGRVLLQD